MNALDEKGVRFIKKDEDKDNEPSISYLNIDAFLETQRVRNTLYKNADSLTKKLKEDGHIVHRVKKYSEIIIEDQKINVNDRQVKIEEVFQFLATDPDVIKIEEKLAYGKSNTLQQEIMKDYLSIHGYLDKEIISKMKNALIGKRDSREYNKLLSAAKTIIYPKTYMFNQRLDHYFPIGKKFTPADILKRTNLLLTETFTGKKLETVTSAIRYLQIFKKVRRTKIKGESVHKIISDNPFDLNILEYKPNPEGLNTRFLS